METKINLLNKYMDALAAHNYFNGAVLVGYKGEVLLKKGYGLSSFQYDVPNTPSTRFRIGSLTKAFTAMAILKLHAKVVLDLDDSINRILPDYPNGSLITIRHLLNQSSGIPSFTSTPEYWTKSMRLPADLNEIIEDFKEMPLEFTPGTDMNYSNSGYLLLTAIIEKVSGVTFDDYLQNEIFDKLELTDTGVDNGRTIVKSLAQGHTVWEKVIHTEHIDMSFPLGAYGMYSTALDLYRWCQALMDNSLIDQDLQEQMFTSLNGYGFGWFIEDGASKEVSHFGDINGFVNHLVVYPDEELVVIVLSNINITPVTQISSDLINIVFGKKVEGIQPFKPVGLESENLVGTYLNGEETLSIHFDKELYAVVPKMYGVPYKFKLVPIEANQEKVICKSDFIHDTYTFHLIEKRMPQSIELIDSYGAKKVYVKSK
ncbi:serine hydrolase domain-containing protein [Neobacillus novalis]|uniref:Serine hydrolase domain-containing protein n=1 Tax=Neobacillus novalis TaxID=220687 RepID=A0AA95SH26_9BACI|nr:serine hydrolase domain-containing protein [Neobacillus novalis]WHY86606.1 serine hydrolase domain-containing protein [Neobacillus novalis]